MTSTMRFNWQIWAGFFLSLFAFLSFFLFFALFPMTRDFPWANLILFGLAAALLLVGARRAFAFGRSRLAKITGLILTSLGFLVFGLFIFLVFIYARQLPASAGAPKVGGHAPEFALVNQDGQEVSLAQLLSTPINGKAPRGVLLIFYRGYW